MPTTVELENDKLPVSFHIIFFFLLMMSTLIHLSELVMLESSFELILLSPCSEMKKEL